MICNCEQTEAIYRKVLPYRFYSIGQFQILKKSFNSLPPTVKSNIAILLSLNKHLFITTLNQLKFPEELPTQKINYSRQSARIDYFWRGHCKKWGRKIIYFNIIHHLLHRTT